MPTQDTLSPEFLKALNSPTGANIQGSTGGSYTVSRYTQPATQTPVATAPAPTATAPTPAIPNVPTVTKPTLQAVDENTIREETRKRMQSTIDAINANFANLISQEQIAGQDRSGQTRAVNSRSGLVGSDFGAAHTEKTNQFNKSQVQALEAQKQAQIQSVLLNIEDRASAEIQARKQEALGQYERDFNTFKEVQEKAREDLKLLASQGVALETLNPAQKAALLKQAGYDDPAFGELVYNAMKPKPAQIDYKFEKLADGKGLFYGVDPVTGQLVTKNVKVDLPPDWQMQIAPDGTVIGYDKNTGEARVLSDKGEFAKPEDPAQLYGGLSKEQRTELQRIQGNVRQDPDIRDFVITRDGFERVQTGANQNNAQGDLALLFGFMKMLDPNSVVRETEFANAEQAQGTLQRVFNIPDRFIRGTRLTEEGRQYFAEAARELYDRKKQSYDRAADFYGNQLDQFGIPRELGLRDFTTTFDAPINLTPLNGPLPQNSLLGKYPYAEVRDYLKQYPGATEEDIRQGLQELGFNKVGKTIASTPYLKTLGAITGLDGSPYWKYGLDIDLKKGHPVRSPVSGKVLAAKYNGGFGLQVKIQGDDGREYWLSHLDATDLKPGQRIALGETVGKGGNTGKVIKVGGGVGSHLDLTVKEKGKYLAARQVKKLLDNIYV